MSSKAISRGIISVATWHGAKIVASAVAAPILARLLGADGYGQYAYYLAIIMIAAPLINLGTFSILTKNIAEHPDDREWRTNIAIFSGLVNLVGIILVGSVIAWLIWTQARWGNYSDSLILVVLGAIVFEQVILFARGTLYGVRREELATLPTAAGNVVSAALGVGLALAGLGLMGVLLGILGANIMVAVITGRYAGRFLNGRGFGQSLSQLPAVSLLKFGLASMFFIALNLVLYRADVILIRYLANDVQAGLYASAVQWSEFVWVVPLAVQSVMLQSTSQLWAENRIGEITALLSRLLRYVALGTAFLLIVVFVFADQILLLYFGPDFVEASLALRLLAPGVFSFSLARIMWPVIHARGNVVSLVLVTLTATLANLALNWFIIPPWGAVGAAIASSIAYGSVIFVYAWMIHRCGVRPFEGLDGVRLLLLCLLTGMLLALISTLIQSALVAVMIGVLAAAVIYGVGILWFGLIRVSEIQEIVDSLPGLLRSPVIWVFQDLKPVLVLIETGLPRKS